MAQTTLLCKHCEKWCKVYDMYMLPLLDGLEVSSLDTSTPTHVNVKLDQDSLKSKFCCKTTVLL